MERTTIEREGRGSASGRWKGIALFEQSIELLNEEYEQLKRARWSMNAKTRRAAEVRLPELMQQMAFCVQKRDKLQGSDWNR